MDEIEYVDIRDESVPQRDGSVAHFKKYTFYIGKRGPFVERFSDADHSLAAVTARVQALRDHLAQLPK